MTKVNFDTHAATLLSEGWPVIPVKGKQPAIKDWRKGVSASQLGGFQPGLGVGLLAAKFPAADIDVRDEQCADAIEKCLLMELGMAPVRYGSKPKRLLMYRADKPFSKIKVFLSGPNGDKDSLGKDFAIEFLGDGQQYVIHGQHPDGFEYSWPNADGPVDNNPSGLTEITSEEVMACIARLPDYLPKGWRIRGQVAAVASSGDALALYKAPLSEWTLDRVENEVLSVLDPDMGHDEWNAVGMSLHHQSEGSYEWLDLWENWSKKGSKWKAGSCQAKWDSFNQQLARGQGAITLATAIKMAREIKSAENIRKFEAVKAKVEECEDAETLRSTICADIQKDLTIDKFHRDVLAAILKTKFKSLGMPVGIAEVKKLIRPKLMEGLPEWLSDWVYITHSDQFFNMSTKRKAKVQGFNAMYNREVGASSSEPGSSAAALALDLFKIPTPDKVMYIPWAGEMFEMNGLPCVNSYNVNSPPDIPAAFSSSDLKALKTIKDHLKLILVDDDAVNVLTHWMAHNVQNPGKKIRWVPLIKGIEGDGKSLIGKIVSMAMGHVNVGVVSPDVIGGSFSSWSEGKCVNVLEEIRLVGHNRYDLVNKLKPYISNDQIEVHRKGENPYDAPNVTNYIAFTNYQDAIPLDDTDRRWWIQFSPFNSEIELREMTGHGYFSELHEAIENHAGAIRRWLLEVEIPVTFQADGRAPFSHAKQKMIAMNVSDEESAAREIIEKGCLGVSKEVVSTTHLTTALSMMEEGQLLQGPAVARLMSKLGFSRVPNPITWQNSTIRVWTKSYRLSKLSGKDLNAEVRKILDATVARLEDDLLS